MNIRTITTTLKTDPVEVPDLVLYTNDNIILTEETEDCQAKLFFNKSVIINGIKRRFSFFVNSKEYKQSVDFYGISDWFKIDDHGYYNGYNYQYNSNWYSLNELLNIGFRPSNLPICPILSSSGESLDDATYYNYNGHNYYLLRPNTSLGYLIDTDIEQNGYKIIDVDVLYVNLSTSGNEEVTVSSGDFVYVYMNGQKVEYNSNKTYAVYGWKNSDDNITKRDGFIIGNDGSDYLILINNSKESLKINYASIAVCNTKGGYVYDGGLSFSSVWVLTVENISDGKRCNAFCMRGKDYLYFYILDGVNNKWLCSKYNNMLNYYGYSVVPELGYFTTLGQNETTDIYLPNDVPKQVYDNLGRAVYNIYHGLTNFYPLIAVSQNSTETDVSNGSLALRSVDGGMSLYFMPASSLSALYIKYFIGRDWDLEPIK